MNIRSYIPEPLLTDKKQASGARICREDCAMIDPANEFCVVACRGTAIGTGGSFSKAYGIPADELRFLQVSLAHHRRVLLRGRERPILIFADLLDASGLLLAVAPTLSAESAARVLLHMGRRDFALSPALELAAANPLHTEDEATYDSLTELFYYTDRILGSTHSIGIWTRTLLVANFTGCMPEHMSLPTEEPSLPDSEKNRLTAFLLCAFLSMRTHDGAVSANAASEQTPEHLFRYRVELVPPTPKKRTQTPHVSLPFLDLPAFRNFSLVSQEGSAVVLEAELHPAAPHSTLRAEGSQGYCIRLTLSGLCAN